MKVRVVYRADGGISVIYPAPKSRRIDWEAILKDPRISIQAKQEFLEHLKANRIEKAVLVVEGWAAELGAELLANLEPEGQWLERVFTKTMQPQYNEEGQQVNPLYGCPYDDIDSSELPQSREDRDAWTGGKGKGVSVDHTKAAKLRADKELEEKIQEKLREMAIKEIEKE